LIEKNLDFRSDTVTKPTPEMREAAAKAEVGDDGYGDDPTVNKLQRLAADMLGKEEGLFVCSGTLGNAVGILAQTQRGDEFIIESSSHIMIYQSKDMAFTGGIYARAINGELGWMRPGDLEQAIRSSREVEFGTRSRTSLISVENTHNVAGGIPLTSKQLESNFDVAKSFDMSVHLDGARIFNAAVALKVNVKELTKFADTVSFCVSKGLSAPVGSVLVGSKEIIDKARQYRTSLGGGMRQAGIIAAPGIVALTKMVDRLAEDHENARLLSEGLKGIRGLKILNPVMTNMVYIDVSGLGWTGKQWAEACEKTGWRSAGTQTPVVRLCTHYGIEREDIESFVAEIRRRVPKK